MYSDVDAIERSKNGELLATGDDFGVVKLFKYPCVKEKASFTEAFGHSSHITKVKFTDKDQFLISTGGNDLSVLVWETGLSKGGTAVYDVGQLSGKNKLDDLTQQETEKDDF